MGRNIEAYIQIVDPTLGSEYEECINRIKGLICGWRLNGNDKLLINRINDILPIRDLELT